MAQIKYEDGDNNTLINKNMVVSIINLATKEIQGVIDVYHSKRLWFLRLFNKNVGKGVKVRYTNLGIVIDIFVVVDTNCEVNDVVYRIQKNVKTNLTALLPIHIKAINVHVKDAEKDSLK